MTESFFFTIFRANVDQRDVIRAVGRTTVQLLTPSQRPLLTLWQIKCTIDDPLFVGLLSGPLDSCILLYRKCGSIFDG